MDQIKIGEFISRLRKEKELTQDDLAEKLGVSTKTISRWETGRNMPDYSILKDLCNILGISVNELINGERIEKDKIIKEYDNNLIKVLKEYKRMKRLKNILFFLFIGIGILLIQFIVIFAMLYFMTASAKVEVNTDITKYNNYMFENAIDVYQDKWGMDESIFPKTISKDMNVEDYKMVYYDPWDKQFLSYLVVEYDDTKYNDEKTRLTNYKSTDYIGYYSVTGFTKYELLAMYANDYQGFVYALDLGNNKICYVEIIFCNYFMDLDYKKYINEDYLPDGFDATIDNKYQKKMLK